MDARGTESGPEARWIGTIRTPGRGPAGEAPGAPVTGPPPPPERPASPPPEPEWAGASPSERPGTGVHSAPPAWGAPAPSPGYPGPLPPWMSTPPPSNALVPTRNDAPAPHELSSSALLRPPRRVPQSGWRRAVYLGTRGAVNPGESEADVERRELIARVNQPLRGCYKIAMLSLKGGVGKTTTTAALGSTFASLRGDRVVALDANPDRGTLAEKIAPETTATVRHLLRDAGRVQRYSDVRAYTSQGPSRLEILAGEQDPAVSEAFSEQDYRAAVGLLERFYTLVLTDCGTGLLHSAMAGVLDEADALLIISSASIDGARSASATLDWLEAHGYRELVARSLTVINSARPSAGSVDLDRVTDHFAARCRGVCRLPFDGHLEQGAEIELERLSHRTRTGLLELAAAVADDFPRFSGAGEPAGPGYAPGYAPGRV